MDIGFLQALGLIAMSAAILVTLGKVVRMPAIVVYLLCGMLLGPGLGWVALDDGLELIAELGIALLLFLVGMELSIGKIKDVGKSALAVGLAQVLITASAGYGIGFLLGFPPAGAAFLGLALTFSSTVVVVKLLEQKGQLSHTYGKISLGVLLVQDLVVIFVLTFLAGMSGGEGAVDAAAVTKDLLKAFGGMLLLLAGALVASKYIFPKLFRWAANAPDVEMIWAISWCFLMVLSAHAFHLSLEVGAFIAGVSLAQLTHNEGLLRRVNPLMNLFVAIFFVTLGLQINLDGAGDKIGIVLSLSAFVLLMKPLLFIVILRVLGHRKKTAFLTGTTLAQTSEFSFILAGLAMSKGLIGDDLMLISALVGVVTIGISSYLITFSAPLLALVEKTGLLNLIFKNTNLDESTDSEVEEMKGHIIIVGMNSLGRELARRLNERGHKLCLVETDPAKLADMPGHHLVGSVNYLAVLEESNFHEAKLIISALQIEETNDLLAYRSKSVGVPCAIHVADLSMIDNLLNLDADYLMVSKVDGMKAQMAKLKEMGVLS